jgi:hypothetical protein
VLTFVTIDVLIIVEDKQFRVPQKLLAMPRARLEMVIGGLAFVFELALLLLCFSSEWRGISEFLSK